jgi:type III restriction enzyme
MKLRFKNQQFQADATNSVCDIFSGQPNESRKFVKDPGKPSSGSLSILDKIGEDVSGWGNAPIKLRPEELLKNLREVQKHNHIVPVNRIETLTSKVEWDDGRKETVIKPVFTVEMETGTGKTYTYIKTMYELNARYGWSKFIIVVPSVAIREGVAKTFKVTADHFKEEYGKACRYFIYNSSRLNDLKQLEDDPGINVMIINTQAFAARGQDAKRIYTTPDNFQSRRPIDVIAKVNPIVIIDEPQSVIGTEGGKNVSRDSLGKFNPLFYVNYSATHRENFNMVYRLDAFDAYQKKLVKKISVKGISVLGTKATSGYLYLQKINTYPNKSPSATVVFEYNATSGSGIGKRIKALTKGDSIYTHSGEIEAYKNGFVISDVNANEGTVEFTNGTIIHVGEVLGDNNEEDVRRIQIRETIMSHLEKERELFKKGVKVLSLFFIDEVAKYRYYDDDGEHQGVYASSFEEEYELAKNLFLEQIPFDEDLDYRAYLGRDSANSVHQGYFSQDKKKHFVDSSIKRGESESSDVDAYDLIMKEKEKLLSTDEPVRFIFSHSALREGWDNPNVFQICTLRASSAEIKKRQEIGRGLRLSVNKDGERMDAEVLGQDAVHDVNTLTVIANESYELWAKTLQDEFREVLKNRPKEVTPALFEGQVLVDGVGTELEVDSSKAADIFTSLKMAGLIKDRQPTDKYNDMSQETKTKQISEVLVNVDEELAKYVKDILNLVESVYDPSKYPLVNDSRREINLNLNTEKFASKEFKAIWEKINQKTYYTVSFDEDRLISACISSLNSKLKVSETIVVVSQGYLEETKQNTPQMRKLVGKQIILEENASKNVTFDLIDEIATPTQLTRMATAKILSGIKPSKFKQFKSNPEEFIREAVKLINEQKATTIIEHITYDKLNEAWNAEEIFADASISGEYGKNIIDAKKHLYDKVRYDSKVEKALAENLDTAENVELYIKLPRGFYINTPMGSYNPDWAISFKEGSVKHIYFVAETKGDTAELQLKGVEGAKINCARKHFAKISNGEVKYDAIDSYEKLLTLINKD